MKSGARRQGGQTERPGPAALKAFLAQYHIRGLLYHCRLARHLTRTGFEVCHIERQNNHADVWVLRLRRGHVPVGREIEWTRQQICLFLKRHGLRYPKKEVVVMVQGHRIKAAFNWRRGQPGWLSVERPKAAPRRDTPS
jgi:hypothetical protein